MDGSQIRSMFGSEISSLVAAKAPMAFACPHHENVRAGRHIMTVTRLRMTHGRALAVQAEHAARSTIMEPVRMRRVIARVSIAMSPNA